MLDSEEALKVDKQLKGVIRFSSLKVCPVRIISITGFIMNMK